MNNLIPHVSTHFRFEGRIWSNVMGVTEGKVYEIIKWISNPDPYYYFIDDNHEKTGWFYSERDTEVSDYSYSNNLKKILE